MDIRPIRTEQDLDRALERLEALWGAPLGSPVGDALDILTTLIKAYEDEHHPIPPPTPIEAIKFRMEQMGLTRKDLERYIGTRARVSEVLGKKRPLTLAMIRKLHDGLNIPLECLVAESVAKKGGNPVRKRPTSRHR